MKLEIQGVHVLFQAIESVQVKRDHQTDNWRLVVRTMSGAEYWTVGQDEEDIRRKAGHLLESINLWSSL